MGGESLSKYGVSAGKIWFVLNEKGPLTKEEILSLTNLSENDFYNGIGWLARENKVAKLGEFYKLDSTNLTQEIGTNAGKIWKILNTWEDADLKAIEHLSNLTNEQIQEALGWLAREDKICINEKNRFSLK